MGSLNGDVVVMRNGRSTSQVSIYNYPEHLNPFYEEDQHKRLRFWKISKKDNEGRRNSFSIGNLREMWAFKPFRLKKKSSTLGINKTSESPPPLRREYVIDNGWNSFDHRIRGSTTSSINGDSFQRNAGYRSSLQNLPSNDRVGFNRNDDYRSTIQVPRANPRFHHQQKPQVQPRRSSHSSMASTNPFESDIDDDNEDINGMISANGGSTSTLSKSTPRKKRRAPAPPTPIRGRADNTVNPTIVVESSQNATSNELCIREDTDIANLTAEIESFVKDKNNDDIETALVITEKIPLASATAKGTSPPQQGDIKSGHTSITTQDKEEKVKPIEMKTEEPMQHTVSNEIITTEVKTTPTSTTETSASKLVEKSSPTPRQIDQVEIESTPTSSKTHSSEIITIETKTTTVVTEPVQGASGQTSISTKTSKEIISNGAIPKKLSNSVIQKSTTVTAGETSKEPKMSPSVDRIPNQEAEVGHVECIHVHVESPKPTPRESHINQVSSFKNEAVGEVITTKTPFILTSPPRQRKSVQQDEKTKETVKMVHDPKSKVIYDLRIQEDQVGKVKPEIMEKPTLPSKPLVERNENVHSFAEIHKPMRNVHIRRASRDEVVIPPTVPPQNNEERTSVHHSNIVASGVKQDPEKAEARTETTLKIQEIPVATNGGQHKEMSVATPQSPHSQRPSLPKAGNSVDNGETNEPTSQLESLYRPQLQMEWKRSTLAPLETNIPPEKRKSVKDIIESINRSQRLLHAAANKDFTIVTGHPPSSPSLNGENGDENLRILEESQREIRRMVYQIDHLDGTYSESSPSNGAMALSASPPPSYNECVGAQKPDNSEVFQKCKVQKEVYDYRESSPISSNLDWNPVPKPKRTKPQNE
ncbi:uncharacterized protein LOC142225621 isoform X2 [Haematobia irritans]|uniref:uncharacterized protein LOC142225621 isoform X2 n=1 Tax=Haematobia irritans TaxID=7368 RepID=UPI003F4FFA1B